MGNSRLHEIIKGLADGHLLLNHCPICGHRMPKGLSGRSRIHRVRICPVCLHGEEFREFIGAEQIPLEDWWLARHLKNAKVKTES